MALYNITNRQEFEEKVLQSANPVLVDFWASGDNSELAREHRVQGIPNMKVFAGGKEIQELIGMRPKQVLIDALEKAVKK